MLKYIACDWFRKKRIEFHEGLNTVLGDSAAHNSIGKSTLLLIIDFVFGGNTYAESSDIIQNLRYHEIRWCFQFGDKEYYFSRLTDKKEIVIICNEKFERIDVQRIGEYCKFLAENYNCVFDELSFRGFVGSFSRIWGRENEDVAHPLKQRGSRLKDDILKLVLFFNKYDVIKAQKELCDRLSEKKKILEAAAREKLIPDIRARDYKSNLEAIEGINREIEQLRESVSGHTQDTVTLVSPEYGELKKASAELKLYKSSLQQRLKRTKLNQIANPSVQAQMKQLSDFFPQLNVDKLAEIDTFHQQLCRVLKDEVNKAVRDLEKQIATTESEIDRISLRMNELVQCDDSTKYIVDRLSMLISNRQHISDCNKSYLDKKELNDQLKREEGVIGLLWGTVLTEIVTDINTTMKEVVERIYAVHRLPPLLSANEKSYKLTGRDDTGTGSAYVNLITFDFSIAQLTCLPILIHDSMLFKNVETPALESIYRMYTELPQQVFIAIDEVQKFDEQTKGILQENSVIELTQEDTLYTKKWNRREEASENNEG